ncbi:MAG: FIST N-terminal domain-containing protein, partial [Campylobacterota bacterium]|nr:FIST N-terminal domain-containing protein [Campylobacterota bacterium]
MKTYNIEYITKKDLEDLQKKNSIKDSEKNLIQVFTANTDIKYIQQLQNSINSIFPKSHLIGTTTDGEICNGKVTTSKTIISITTFMNTTLK